ncbi:MAG TPA: type VI secretion system baseplate subunit TssK, partial [Polyangiaceae bacterium]|nr:type VI secretion system baseplate subunit TssK [Polyangiaceae bacterium]
MNKRAHQMSRVYWHMGQALLPEHFYAQEQALREELSTHFAVRAAPGWGVSRLVWDDFRLRKGTIAVDQLTVLLRSGILIDVPGNTAPAQLDLSAAGVTRAQVYLHLHSDHDTVVEHADAGADSGGIERIVQKIELSTKAYSDASAEVFALAELACGADGTWELVPEFCPALLQIGAEPFFRSVLTRMDAVARALRELLKNELSDNYLAAEGQASTKQCLRGLYGFEAFVLDIKSGIRPHPYALFRALRELYLDVCMFREVHPDKLTHAYDHENIAPCIGALLEELEQQVQIVRAQLPYVEFRTLDGRHVCSFDAR